MTSPAEGGDFHLAKTGDFYLAVDTRGRLMVKWFVGLVAAIFAALFALPSSATASPASPAAIAYTYGGQHHSSVLRYTTHERGPPATDDRATDSDAESLRSHGPSANQRDVAASRTYTDNHHV